MGDKGARGEIVPDLTDGRLLASALVDVAVQRERSRQRRLFLITLALFFLCAFLLLRTDQATGRINIPRPEVSGQMGATIIIVVLLASVMVIPLLAAGRSPHVLYRASEIDVGLDDVKGSQVVRDEVIRTLNLFLAYKTFHDTMGGTPRRAILFEGPPGTGKTYMAKAMAREAGVPFLYVSSSAFQSMYYGQTNRKMRSYFRALRKAARREGGAIGFIEEIDAIGGARAGMGGKGEGVAGVVNELLIQLQSFDEPPNGVRFRGWLIDQVNRLLPVSRQMRKPKAPSANVLVVGATNRAGDLDPALLRPGRFDRTIYFDLPSRAERREIIDYYLARKSHVSDLDDPATRDWLAATTAGYSPVMIEHVFDEALVWALRRGATALDAQDLQRAKLTEELGLGQHSEYNPHERAVTATHEAGHATVAYFTGKAGFGETPSASPRNLEVLSVVKRRMSLGVLGHSDVEERYTWAQSDLYALVKIALGGLVAEEIWFGEHSSGPGADLASATGVAASMIGTYGMAGSLISLDAVDKGGNIVAKVLADDDTRKKLDTLLNDAKSEVESLLRDNTHIVEALRDALLERDELVGDEILDVIRQAEADRIVIDLRDHAPPLRSVPEVEEPASSS